MPRMNSYFMPTHVIQDVSLWVFVARYVKKNSSSKKFETWLWDNDLLNSQEGQLKPVSLVWLLYHWTARNHRSYSLILINNLIIIIIIKLDSFENCFSCSTVHVRHPPLPTGRTMMGKEWLSPPFYAFLQAGYSLFPLWFG